MELAFLVYWVNNLTYNGSFLLWAALVPLIMWFTCYIGTIFHKGIRFVKPRKSWFVVGMFLLTLHTLLPNKQTTIYCVSAYLVQTVLTDSRTQELGTAAYEATLTQLKEWGKQSDDVAKLIKPLVEKAINEKVNPATTVNK